MATRQFTGPLSQAKNSVITTSVGGITVAAGAAAIYGGVVAGGPLGGALMLPAGATTMVGGFYLMGVGIDMFPGVQTVGGHDFAPEY